MESSNVDLSAVDLSAEFVRVKQQRNRRDRQQIGRSILAFLAGNSEPKIDRVDADNWRVFDPVSRQTLHFSSEQEVRIWLEQRYSF
ncbi:MAG: hypothetical protein HC895_09810 [Leptolyngbyaceae cyanobacterium SM1_3_5]|nr:hypothetical protein [Leptolyngbyaceae cyanobacterium SM1_3_5]